jgi:23S rRNA (cytidine2498-2'-O)-methyltransferase
MILSAYLAPAGLEQALSDELTRAGVRIEAWHGRLALSPDPPVACAWALDIWSNPQEIYVPSVKTAADELRKIQRNWSAYAVNHHRRAALIAEHLPSVKARPLVFPEPAPSSHLGAWTLLAHDRMLMTAKKSSPFVNGECTFQEDHIGPPSRAYLKLWEAFTRLGVLPMPGETCLDLGAAPGGWTFVLAKLGALVTAVDKAHLDQRVANMPGVTWLEGSAFSLAPEPVDWLFSDVVAYPDRLFLLVSMWIASGAARRVLCTLKFQGDTDHETTERFGSIPGGRIMHLWHNKHELTFYWQRPGPTEPHTQAAVSDLSPIEDTISTVERSTPGSRIV